MEYRIVGTTSKRYWLWFQRTPAEYQQEYIRLRKQKDHNWQKPHLAYAFWYGTYISQQWSLFRDILHQTDLYLLKHYRGTPPVRERGAMSLLADYSDIRFRLPKEKLLLVPAIDLDDIQTWFDNFLELANYVDGFPYQPETP